ncbi:MAG: T9SS type A sorting domain-containing protein [Bacteroidia bacterium]|nr:T9SS type A sorting domain-containing protein [Bacteroidia bacterium]
MKKVGFFCLTLTIFSFSQAQVVTSGLIGYWPFSGNANDQSSNTNHGKVTGAQLTTDRFGVSDAAYYFDGNNDFINLGNHSSLFPQSITVNIWFQYTAGSRTSVLVGSSNSLNGEWGLNILNSSTNVGLAGGIAAGSNNHAISYHSFDHYDDGNWHMVTLVYTTSNKNRMAFYIDGCFQGYNNSNGSSGGFSGNDRLTFNTSEDWIIGAHSQYFSSTNNAGPRYFLGKLDDLAIYDRALTPMEIKKMFVSETVYDTIEVKDTTFVTVYDTLPVFDTTHVTVYDTTVVTKHVYDTTFINIPVMDTITTVVYDTTRVEIFDTTYITVNDTLRIHLPDQGGGSQLCDIRVYPNPTNDVLHISSRLQCSLENYGIRIINDIGQVIYTNDFSEASFSVNLDAFTTDGLYILEITNPTGGLVTRRKIVLY